MKGTVISLFIHFKKIFKLHVIRGSSKLDLSFLEYLWTFSIFYFLIYNIVAEIFLQRWTKGSFGFYILFVIYNIVGDIFLQGWTRGSSGRSGYGFAATGAALYDWSMRI